jgi:hypothetical protein
LFIFVVWGFAQLVAFQPMVKLIRALIERFPQTVATAASELRAGHWAGVRIPQINSRIKPLNQNPATAFPLSSPNENLSRLGSGERNPPEAEARGGPRERERPSHWAGVRWRLGFMGRAAWSPSL